MDGRTVRDAATAVVGAAAGALAAWVVAVSLGVAPGGSPGAAAGGSAEPDGRRASAPSAVLDRWTVPDAGWQRSVVQVRNQRCDGSISGTGVVVDGHVLTNVHVVDGAARLEVGTHDGRRLPVVAVAVSGTVDLAELTVDATPADLPGPGLPLAPVGPSAGKDDRWTMAGFPAGTHYRVRSVGVTDVLRGGRFPDPVQAWHLDADVAGGESGSPIVDAEGRLAGLLYARALADGEGLAMGADTIRSARRDLVARPLATC